MTAEASSAADRAYQNWITRAIDVDNHYYETDRSPAPATCPRSSSVAVCRCSPRQAHLRRDGWRRQPLHPEPDVRPDHRAGLPGPACSAVRSLRASTPPR
jgi:hypothetical protein